MFGDASTKNVMPWVGSSVFYSWSLLQVKLSFLQQFELGWSSNEKFLYVKINIKFLCIERKQIRFKMKIYLFVYFTRRIEL